MSDLSPSGNDFARRDRFVVWAANRVLALASPHYRAMVKGSIAYGLDAAAKDALMEVRRLDVSEGDTLAVTFPRALSHSQLDHLHSLLTEALPGVRALVFEGPVDLTVVAGPKGRL